MSTACDFTPERGGEFRSDELQVPSAGTSLSGRSPLRRFLRSTFSWEGVPRESCRGEDGAGRIFRSVIVGGPGEATPFEFRYFEMEPGYFSGPARHPREHVVIGVKGKGSVMVGERSLELNPLDVLHIAPGELHRVGNREEQPFGFFCIVGAGEETVAELLQDELNWLQEAGKGR